MISLPLTDRLPLHECIFRADLILFLLPCRLPSYLLQVLNDPFNLYMAVHIRSGIMQNPSRKKSLQIAIKYQSLLVSAAAHAESVELRDR
jgi:hypothetical protein